MSNCTEQSDEHLEAAAILFRIARAHASQYSEPQLNNNASLRKDTSRRIMEEAKANHPDIPSETWNKAAQELASRSD